MSIFWFFYSLVDLSTGERTAFTEAKAIPMDYATGIAIDEASNRALVVDSNEARIVAVDLDSQAISILSDNDTANSIQNFFDLSGIVLDSTNNRALVTDIDDNGNMVLLAVDLNTGARTLISDNSSQGATSITHAWGVVLDSDNNRALAVSYNDEDPVAIVAIDITTGIQTVLSDDANADSAISFDDPLGITLDKDNNRALLTDSQLNVVIAMDLTTGARTSFFSNETPNANHLFDDPEGIILDKNNNRALITDSELGAVLAMDLNTGERTVLSNNQTDDSLNKQFFPKAITLDATNNRILVTASLTDLEESAARAIVIANNALIAIDLTTGHRTIISDNDTPDGGEVLDGPVGVTLDSNNNRALILEGGRTRNALIAVDLTTGIRSVFSNNTTPDDVNTFSKPSNVTLDSANNRALVTSTNIGILAVDLTTGARTVMSDEETPDASNELGTVNAITVDAENNRALVVDSYVDAVFAVDLTTGARTILSDNTAPNDNNIFYNPAGLAIDTINNRLIVLDTRVKTVFAVDLESSQRVVLSGVLLED